MTECKLTGVRSISPNGTFIFEVRNRIDLDMDNFHSLKLTLGVEYYDYKWIAYKYIRYNLLYMDLGDEVTKIFEQWPAS